MVPLMGIESGASPLCSPSQQTKQAGRPCQAHQKVKGATEDEMVGWHHQLDGHGFGWTPGVGDGQGGLECCSS